MWGSAYTQVIPHSQSRHSRSLLLLRDAHSVCVLHTAWTISRTLARLECVKEWAAVGPRGRPHTDWLLLLLLLHNRTSCISAQSTSVGSQCRRQTDTSIFLVWARHTNAARPTLAAVSGTHRFQVSCAHLPMPTRPGATVSFWLHPERRRFQLPPSPVVVILAACDPTYTAVHCWWSCISGCRMPPLEQSSTRRHLSFNAVCFSKPPQNLFLFPIISFLIVFGF